MTQLSPEVNFHFREDTLLENKDDYIDTSTPPATEDVLILGYDTIDTSVMPTASPFSPDFIGPHDATDEARHLLENQGKNLAQVAVMSIEAYGREYRKVALAAKLNIAMGYLRLNSDFPIRLDTDSPIKNVDQQIDAFVTQSMMGAYKSHDEVLADLEEEKIQQRQGPDKKLQDDLISAKKELTDQGMRILEVRTMLEARGASAEFMRDFDYTTKLMSKPDQEIFEREKELTPTTEVAPLVSTGEIRLLDRFMGVLGSSFGRRALRSIGISSPKSGEIKVIDQHDSTSR